MKFYSLCAGLCLSASMSTFAHAQIVQGTMDAYFSQVYATDLTGKNVMSQYDAACKTKYWFLVNTQFFVDYRVNTTASSHSAFFNYANVEHTMGGTLNKTTGSYEFKTDQLAQSLKDMHAKSLLFTLTGDFRWGTAQLVLEGVQVPAMTATTDDKKDGDPCDCDKKPNPSAYQCVLST